MSRTDRVVHGAIALIKVDGIVIGKMRSISATENFTRGDVQGLGTIYSTERPAMKFVGTLSCEFMSVSFTDEGIRNAIRRNLPNLASRVWDGEISLEDQLSIDSDTGVQVNIFRKVQDALNPDGTVKPKAIPYAIIENCLIDSDSFNISEGAIAGHSQAFTYLRPIQYVANGE